MVVVHLLAGAAGFVSSLMGLVALLGFCRSFSSIRRISLDMGTPLSAFVERFALRNVTQFGLYNNASFLQLTQPEFVGLNPHLPTTQKLLL